MGWACGAGGGVCGAGCELVQAVRLRAMAASARGASFFMGKTLRSNRKNRVKKRRGQLGQGPRAADGNAAPAPPAPCQAGPKSGRMPAKEAFFSGLFACFQYSHALFKPSDKRFFKNAHSLSNLQIIHQKIPAKFIFLRYSGKAPARAFSVFQTLLNITVFLTFPRPFQTFHQSISCKIRAFFTPSR